MGAQVTNMQHQELGRKSICLFYRMPSKKMDFVLLDSLLPLQLKFSLDNYIDKNSDGIIPTYRISMKRIFQ